MLADGKIVNVEVKVFVKVLVEELVKLFCNKYWQNPQIIVAVHNFKKKPPEMFCKKRCS